MSAAPAPVALAREWLDDYRRERDGSIDRAEALLRGLRQLADSTSPESMPHEAFSLLLELLRMDDDDLDFDGVEVEG